MRRLRLRPLLRLRPPRPARVRGGAGGEAGADAGSAVVELLVLGLVLLVPLVYVVLVLARVQAGAYAVQAASRSAARALTSAPDGATGALRASDAVELALTDQGFAPAAATVATRCEAAGCLAPGTSVDVTVRLAVPLPGVPRLFASAVPVAVPVEATSVAVTDRLRPSPAP